VFSAAPGSPFAVGGAPASLAVADLNGDGVPDLVTSNHTGGVSVLIGSGSGAFTVTAGPATGVFADSVAVGDVNGDGRADLVVANKGSSTVMVWVGDGSGGFAAVPGSPFDAGPTPQAVVIADVNGDGHPDLAIANQPRTR